MPWATRTNPSNAPSTYAETVMAEYGSGARLIDLSGEDQLTHTSWVETDNKGADAYYCDIEDNATISVGLPMAAGNQAAPKTTAKLVITYAGNELFFNTDTRKYWVHKKGESPWDNTKEYVKAAIYEHAVESRPFAVSMSPSLQSNWVVLGPASLAPAKFAARAQGRLAQTNITNFFTPPADCGKYPLEPTVALVTNKKYRDAGAPAPLPYFRTAMIRKSDFKYIIPNLKRMRRTALFPGENGEDRHRREIKGLFREHLQHVTPRMRAHVFQIGSPLDLQAPVETNVIGGNGSAASEKFLEVFANEAVLNYDSGAEEDTHRNRRLELSADNSRMIEQVNPGYHMRTTRKRRSNGGAQKYTITIGGSNGKVKSSTLPSSKLTCPGRVDKGNWKGGHNYNDWFKVSVSGSSVTVTRGDTNTGWGMNLQFECVLGGQCAETNSTACHPWGRGANTEAETIKQCGPDGANFAQYADCTEPLAVTKQDSGYGWADVPGGNPWTCADDGKLCKNDDYDIVPNKLSVTVSRCYPNPVQFAATDTNGKQFMCRKAQQSFGLSATGSFGKLWGYCTPSLTAGGEYGHDASCTQYGELSLTMGLDCSVNMWAFTVWGGGSVKLGLQMYSWGAQAYIEGKAFLGVGSKGDPWLYGSIAVKMSEWSFACCAKRQRRMQVFLALELDLWWLSASHHAELYNSKFGPYTPTGCEQSVLDACDC